MNDTRATLLDAVFSEALDLAGRDRVAFLEKRCRGDLRMRREVDRLLHAAEASDERLERPFEAARGRLWRSLAAAEADPQEDLTGQRIGGWLIEERIARGGLATVYRAHRGDRESGQTVAFKALRRGLDTDDIVARFRTERRILSSLDHPAIARAVDGGALPDGRPFLVLEFVSGQPITAWCEARALERPARLRLLVDVLGALHHAHLRRVVHRDVKPSNVLVSDEGKVVLVDFGIAKVLDAGAGAGGGALTGVGMALLTPGYGSPEQRAGGAVGPASDVYQAGLLLYELLTGKQAFDGRPAEADATVPAPSAALRGSPTCERVRGDLDAIARKATQVDPARRYATAEEMARDLLRHLEGRPVLARVDASACRFPTPKLPKARRMHWIAVAAAGIAAYMVIETV